MLGKDFIFNGLTIPWSKAQGIAAGWYADVDWKSVAVRNFQTPRQDFHGTVSAPTFMEGRLITVSGEICIVWAISLLDLPSTSRTII